MRRLIALEALVCAGLLGQAGPYERQKVDPEAARRGRAIWAQNCINCHGNQAKGTDTGPDLMRSPLLMRDRLGNELGPALKTLPGHNPNLTSAQVTDLTHFLKQLIEASAKNRNPTQSPNVLTGNAEAGRAYFDGPGGCTKCHSATGDLKGIGSKIEDASDLQQRFLFPRRTKPMQVKVTVPVRQLSAASYCGLTISTWHSAIPKASSTTSNAPLRSRSKSTTRWPPTNLCSMSIRTRTSTMSSVTWSR